MGGTKAESHHNAHPGEPGSHASLWDPNNRSIGLVPGGFLGSVQSAVGCRKEMDRPDSSLRSLTRGVAASRARLVMAEAGRRPVWRLAVIIANPIERMLGPRGCPDDSAPSGCSESHASWQMRAKRHQSVGLDRSRKSRRSDRGGTAKWRRTEERSLLGEVRAAGTRPRSGGDGLL